MFFDKVPGILTITADAATTLGAGAVFIAYLQFRQSISGQARSAAITAWQDYLKMALAYPDLTKPSQDNIDKALNGEPTPYRWFVSTLLFASEQVIGAFPKDPEWRMTVRNQISSHSSYISKKDFGKRMYAKEVLAIIEELQSESLQKSAAVHRAAS